MTNGPIDTYASAVHYLETLPRFGKGLGLERMRRILKKLGDPQRGLRCVHVTGTNGKGSTCAMIASILRHAGQKTGLFTSPHLSVYNERMQVNGEQIDDDDFVTYVNSVIAVVDDLVVQTAMEIPALFEVLVAVAFLHFKKQQIDIAVIEVGIGGLLDSTNVIDGLVAVITNVDLEHTEILGATKEEIAAQKAGIIKEGALALTAETDPEVLRVLTDSAVHAHAQFVAIGPNDVQLVAQDSAGQSFHFRQYKDLHIPLLGRYQMRNAALAILTVEGLRDRGVTIGDTAVREGLRTVYWPLRLEIVHHGPEILIDVGHNLHGVRTVHEVLQDLFLTRRKILVMGVSYDKPYKEMARILSDDADRIILTKAQYHAVDPEALRDSVNVGKETHLTTNVREAMQLAKTLAGPDDLIMVLGGLYLGAEARSVVDEIFAT